MSYFLFAVSPSLKIKIRKTIDRTRRTLLEISLNNNFPGGVLAHAIKVTIEAGNLFDSFPRIVKIMENYSYEVIILTKQTRQKLDF